MNRRKRRNLIISVVAAIVCVLALVLVLRGCDVDKNDATSDLESIQSKGKIVVGMECKYAPYNWTTTTEGEHTVPISNNPGAYADGYDVVIAKAIAEALGVELEIRAIEWDGLIPALEAGEIDMIIAGMSPTEERKLSIDFTDTYLNSELVMVVRKDGVYTNATSIQDFSGAKISGQLNTFHYGVIDQINGVNKDTARADFGVLIMALGSGAIDGYVCEEPGAIAAVAANPNFTYIAFANGNGFEYDPLEASISVGLRKGSNLTAEINKILASLDSQKLNLMREAIARQPVTEVEGKQ